MKLCECGCGQELPDSLSHGKVRRFIAGHQFRGENHPMFGKRGEKSPNFGKPCSEETKEKIRKSLLGKPHSEERKRKNSEVHRGEKHPMFGKHLSEETKRNWIETFQQLLTSSGLEV